MSQPFRFRHANEIAGGFVLAGLALLVGGLLAAGRAQRWFERREEFRVRFPAEGTFGLQPGAEAHILGTPAGALQRVEIGEEGAMEGVVRIRGDFAPFLREGSEAVVRRKFVVAGDAFLEITVGTGPPLELSPGTYLPFRKDPELVEIVEELLGSIRGAVVPALDELGGLLAAYRRLGEELAEPGGAAQQALARIESLLAGLDRGEGVAGGLLKDRGALDRAEELLDEILALVREAGETLRRGQGILDDVQRAAGVLPETAETVRGELDDVPGTVRQARSALQEAETLLAGLQRHWLLRGAMRAADPVPAPSIHEALPPDGERP